MLESQTVHERRKQVTMSLGEKSKGRVTCFSHFELDPMAKRQWDRQIKMLVQKENNSERKLYLRGVCAMEVI